MVKLVILGDSITYGYDGHVDGQPVIANDLGKLANVEVTNQSVGGTTLSDDRGLPGQVAKTDFKQYDYVLIAFGTNDFWQQNESIGVMQSSLQLAISQIKSENPTIKIFLTTPMQVWVNGATSLDSQNRLGISQNAIDDMLANVANLNDIRFNDWRNDPIVTSDNHNQTLGDTTVHPTTATQALMARRFFNIFFDGQQVSAVTNNHNSHEVQPATPVTPPHHQVAKLALVPVSTSNFIPPSTDNFKKIFKVVSEQFDVEIKWEPRTPEYLNRAAYLYLYRTMKLIISLLTDQLGSNSLYDDDMNKLSADDLIIPHSLLIQEIVDVLNFDFKKIAELLNQVIQINEGGD